MQPLVTVVTPTIGNLLLRTNLISVAQQTHSNLQHLIVVDGDEYLDKVRRCIAETGTRPDVIALPYATGKERFNGHRIYGAAVYLAKGDLIAFLDEDNWFEREHIKSLIDVLTGGFQWAFALRKIVDSNGTFVCNDDCESLGKWPSVLADNDFFVDVSCYLLPRSIAIQTSPIWFRKAREPGVPEVDRVLTQVMRTNGLSYDTNGKYTVNYRAGSTALSVSAGFFIEGNRKSTARYGGVFPWRKQ